MHLRTLGQTGDRLAEELRHLFGLGLVCDTDLGFEQAARHREALQEFRRRGGLVAPNIYPADLDPACRDANWWKYPEAECVRLLRIAQQRFAALDLGPMEAVNGTRSRFSRNARFLDVRENTRLTK